MRARRSMQVGWGAALSAVLLVGCSGTVDAPSSQAHPGESGSGAGASDSVAAQRGAALAVTPGVPDDFPRMLGCAAEELGNPDDPAVRGRLKRICDAAQVTLYAISQDASLSEEQQTHHALMMIGVALEQMTQTIVAAQPPVPDAGVQPRGGQHP